MHDQRQRLKQWDRNLPRQRGVLSHCLYHEGKMSNEEIKNLAKDAGTFSSVYQLVCGKQAFGLNYKVGYLVEAGKVVKCGTIAELHAIGWANERFLIIDENWHNLKVG